MCLFGDELNTFFLTAQQLLVGQGLFIVEASRTHSLRLLYTSDRPVADT
jgi:hypothetical protein